MRAIILAGGVGSRLRPITDIKPKTLVKVAGKPMLGHMIDALVSNGVTEVVIVPGFKAELVKNYVRTIFPHVSFKFVDIKRFDETNNMYGLYMAREYLDRDVLIMNGDLVFDGQIINKLTNAKGTFVAVDKGRYLDESMKIVVSNGIISEISKKINPSRAYGTSIDIYKFSSKDLKVLVEEMQTIIEKEGEERSWTEVALDRIFKKKKVAAKPMPVGKCRWYEVDNYVDLMVAEKLFNNSFKRLKESKMFFIDKDGTLTLSGEVISGADEFINKLQEKKKSFKVLTNNSSRTRNEHLESFKKSGVNLNKNNVLVSLDVCLEYLKKNKYQKIYWVANKKVGDYIAKLGFVKEATNPEAVVLTYDDEITYKKLKKLVRLVGKGIPYFATHGDLVCPTKNGPIPDIGTYIELVRSMVGILPNKIFGKPDKEMVMSVLEKKKIMAEDAVVIGDRLYTDMKLANNAGMISVLVLTGETSRADYEDSDYHIDMVVSSVNDLIEYL